MQRSSIGFGLFCAAAIAAICAMVATAKSRQIAEASRIAAVSVPIATTPGPIPVIVDEPPPVAGLPPGYRSTNACNFTRARLRELSTSEEYYYSEMGTYTSDMSKLSLQKRTGDVVVLRVVAAGPAGWSGEATHPALPGKSCVIYAGVVSSLPGIPQTMADHTQPLGERDLVCDKP